LSLVSGNKDGVPAAAPDGALMQAAALGIAPKEFLLYRSIPIPICKRAMRPVCIRSACCGAFRDEKELRENGAEYLAERPEDIAELVKRLNQCKNN